MWSPKEIPVGAALLVLGLWAAAVPLVGPYFDFGFDSDEAWAFSERHGTTSIVPGLAVAVGGLLLLRPRRGLSGLGRVLASLGGLWLLIGPSLYPVWSDEELQPVGPDWKQALLWIGYFYGVGAIVVWLAGYAQGLVTGGSASRRRRSPSRSTSGR